MKYYRLMIRLLPDDRQLVDRLEARGINVSSVCREAIVAKVAYLDRRPHFEEGDEVFVVTREEGLYNGCHGIVKGFWNELVEVFLSDGRVIMFGRHDIKIGDW